MRGCASDSDSPPRRIAFHAPTYDLRPTAPASPAFTLTELLIVMGIIVLFVTLALPAFNLIGGSKSIAGSENEISALLGRARNEAIGVQDYRGLALYRDAATDRYAGAIVSAVTFSGFPGTSPSPFYARYSYVTYKGHQYVALQDVPADTSTGTTPPANAPATSSTYWSLCDSYSGSTTLDITPDSDVQTLPIGVGVQLINNCAMSGSTRKSNGYLPIGVILFNSEGILTALKSVSFAVYGHLGTAGSFSAYPLVSSQTSIPYYLAGTTPAGLPLNSSFGLVAYDKQAFENNNFYSSLTPQFPTQLTSTSTNGVNSNYTAGTTGTGDGQADAWLDTNSTPLLINRYNGTLIRSE